MALGRKTGGRVANTPNHNKQKLIVALKKKYGKGWHPVEKMAEIAEDRENSIDLRAQMYKEVSQYVEPKRKAIEVTGADGGPVHTVISAQPMSQDDWESMYAKPDADEG